MNQGLQLNIDDLSILRVVWAGILLSAVFTVTYGYNGGLYKISLLGSSMDPRSFRFLNFNEVPREYTYLLQIARRIVLPAVIFGSVVLLRLGSRQFAIPLLLSCILQIVAGAMTFARAPFVMLVVALAMGLYFTQPSVFRKFLTVLSSLVLLVVVSGSITFLQYNIVDFDIGQVITTGIDFSINRAWLVPAAVPINLSFSVFNGYDDSLLLSGSRLFGLFSGKVIGTLQADSYIVAPVGYVGDIWRNFGVVGVFLSPIFFGLFFRWLDRIHANVSKMAQVVGSFFCVCLVFYWIMGVVFSAGAFLTLLVVSYFYKTRPVFIGSSRPTTSARP